MSTPTITTATIADTHDAQIAALARGNSMKNSMQQQSINQTQSLKNQAKMEKDRLQQAAKDKVRSTHFLPSILYIIMSHKSHDTSMY